MAWSYSALHVVLVTRYSDGDIEVEIDHGKCPMRGRGECPVEWEIAEMGVTDALLGFGWYDKEILSGDYAVQAWGGYSYVPGEPTEYDAGVDVFAVGPRPTVRMD